VREEALCGFAGMVAAEEVVAEEELGNFIGGGSRRACAKRGVGDVPGVRERGFRAP
jgi:hypothetical protein